MAENPLCGRTLCAVLLASALFCFGYEASAQSQTNSPAAASTSAVSGTASTATAYEVVSIKPNHSGISTGGWKPVPDGFVFTNMPLKSLLFGAYGITMDSQIKGLPEWAGSEAYDIQARVDADTAAAWQKMTWNERDKQEQLMNQALLADRCQFKAHQETQELPVYDLVIANGGLKIKEAPPNENGSYRTSSRGIVTAHGMPVSILESSLSGSLGRMIVDKTGLGEKKFDFELKWTPDNRVGTNDAPDAAPSLFTALEEQLGLKLVPAKGPVEVLVIDHMERPSAN